MMTSPMYTARNTATATQVEHILSLCAELPAIAPSWTAQCAEYAATAETLAPAIATVVIDNLIAARRVARRNAARNAA